jgi:hypothetical protein
MATKIGGSGVHLHQASSDPGSPVAGQVYWNTSSGEMRLYDGTRWGVVNRDTDFLLRHVITTGFVAGGYQSSSPWTNVNEMSHATDICIDRGNVLTQAGSYLSGACSLTQGYVFGADGTWPGTTTTNCKYNLWTITGSAATASRHARNDSWTFHKEHQMAWIWAGGNANNDVLNLSNDTMYTADQGVNGPSAGDGMQSGAAGHSGENHGYGWWDSSNGTKITFSTGTNATYASTNAGGPNSQQKGVSSKHDKGYGGNEGSYSGGYNFRRMDYNTDTVTATVTKPLANTGEENFDMGQDWQYALGTYDGAQNNRGHKFFYSTDSGYELGAGSIRTGVPGGSSGTCHWRGS